MRPGRHLNAGGNFWGDTGFPTISSDWDQPSHSFAVKLATTLSSTAVNEFSFREQGTISKLRPMQQAQHLIVTLLQVSHCVSESDGRGPAHELGARMGILHFWHQAPWQNHEDLFIWKDDFSKVSGKSDFKFGALVSHNIKNELAQGANGIAQYCGTSTHTGNAIAELLLKDVVLAMLYRESITTNHHWVAGMTLNSMGTIPTKFVRELR